MASPVPHVAFLRGINVGGHRVTNDRLQAELSAVGLTDVTGYQAAGNLVFGAPDTDTSALEASIEQQLGEALGYAVPTMVRSLRHVADVAGRVPFGSPPPLGTTVHVAFLKAAPGASARKATLALATPLDELHLEDRELYWLRHGKLMDTTIVAADLARALGVATTMRTATTLQRLVAKFLSSG